MKVAIYRDPEVLSRAAAERFVEMSQRSITDYGRFNVALSGGNTPRQTYELLAIPPWRDQVNWDKIHIFWGDERCVPADDPRNNALMARQALLDKVPIPSDQVHAIACDASPKIAALHYDSLLRFCLEKQDFSFDLIFLGLGEDGHTASLFPGSRVLSEKFQWVTEVSVAGQEFSRITLTFPVINRSRVVIFLVSGSEKAEVLKKVVWSESRTTVFPAAQIKPVNGEVYWMVDEAAALLLDRDRIKDLLIN